MSASVVQAQYEQLEQIAACFAAAAEQQQVLLERVNRQVEVLRSGAGRAKAWRRSCRRWMGRSGRRNSD